MSSLPRSVSHPMSRRTMLKAVGIGGLTIAGSSFIAACSGASTDTTAGGAAPDSGPIQKGGTLRVGLAGGGATSTMDPAVQQDTMSGFAGFAMTNQLTAMNKDFELENVLAEQMDHNADGTEWTVRLKDGVEFHNGKTLDADDVIFSFTRILDPETHATAAGTLAMIDSMSKVDPRTVKFTLSRPTAWFDIAVGDGGATGIVPVGFDAQAPVGTGAFKFKSWEPGVRGEFERFDNHFGQVAQLDSVAVQILQDDSARYNALLSDQVDAVLGLTSSQITQLKSNAELVMYNSPAGLFTPISMRTDSGPLADARVRQALRLSLDREQVVASAYGGFAEPGSDVYGRYDGAFDKSLKRERDLDAARALVKEAGQEGANLTLVTSAINPGAVPLCQVLATSAAEVGLNVQVDVVDVATLFGPNYLQWDFAVDSYPALSILTTSSLADGPDASINTSHFNDPEYNDLWNKASAEFDLSKRADYLQQMQQIQFERGGWIIAAFPNVLGAYRKNISGFTNDVSGFGMTRNLHLVGYTS